MSALARILLEKGSRVCGSDATRSEMTVSLAEKGAEVYYSSKLEELDHPFTVVYSTAISQMHPEMQAAKRNNLQVIHRSQLLFELMQDKKALLVAGTHGKTTTTSLLAHVMTSSLRAPSFAIGGTPSSLQTNGKHGEGHFFVAEADESDGSFLKSSPFGAIVTNLENDHLDYWKTEKALIEAFAQFASQIKYDDHFFWCKDDPHLNALKLRGNSYGFSQEADLCITQWYQDGFSLLFDFVFQEKEYFAIELPLIGKHNVLNGVAVFGLCLSLGLKEEEIRSAFKTFQGVKRRMEKKGEKRGVVFYDDYAHHPTEIIATLEGLRNSIQEKRLVVAFQPHRYSRMKECWKQFLKAFQKDDIVVMTEIYSAGETPIEGITALNFFEELNIPSQKFFVERAKMAEFFSSFLRPHDVFISLGAGDITKLSLEILEKPIHPYKVALVSGGKSIEREVSLNSMTAMTEDVNPYYTFYNFTISKKGEWFLDEVSLDFATVVHRLKECDICFPMLHGPFGEDGMLQGFLETLQLPYTGPDFRTAPLVMDKAWTKRIALTYGVTVADFIDFSSQEWKENRKRCLKKITETLSFPLYVKPVHLGSSVGVYCVKTSQELQEAIDEAILLDDKLIVEEAVQGREIEFGLLGNNNVFVTDPSEVPKTGAIYGYADKYGKMAVTVIPKVKLEASVIRKGKELAKTIYKAFGCSGFSRIDFFLKEDGSWVLNEVNPIPGCTKTSGYPIMMEQEGISRRELFDRLIILGLHKNKK